MAAVQSNEKGAHKVTQLRTPPRAGAETEDLPGDDTMSEVDETPSVSKARLVRTEPRRTHLRGRTLSVSVILLAGAALSGGALYGIRTATQHGVPVPFVNDRAAAPSSPVTSPRGAPTQFAFDSAPVPQPGLQGRNTQGVAAPITAPVAPTGAEPASPAAAIAGGQAALILDLARQIGAVKTQNEKMATDLADAKKALATLVTDNAAGFGTVNGALGEIRHRVDRIDDSLRARAEPAATELSEKPVTAAGAKSTASAAANEPGPPTPAAPATAAAAAPKIKPIIPVTARKAYRVTSGSPSVALIVGNDGQTRMVHPVGMAELPGDSSLPGWGAITELRQVGENWEVVTEHGVIR